jgi:hypothetical protein
VVSYGASSSGVIVSKDYVGFELFIYQSTFNAYVGGAANGVGGTTILSPNKWYFVSLVRTNGILNTYVNAFLDATASNAANASNSGQALQIGERPGNLLTYFNGIIDDVRIYNRALSAGEILIQYEWPVGGRP